MENAMRSIEESNLIQKIALAYMIAWAISPPLAYGTSYRVLFVLCFVVWDVCAILKRDTQFLNRQLLLYLFLAALVFIAYQGDGSLAITHNLQIILFFLFMPVFDYYYTAEEDTTWILVFVMGLVVTWNITTLIGYSQVRNVSRLLAKDFEGAEVYARQGIGGYGYIYFLTFIIPIIEGILIRGYRKFHVVFTLLGIAAWVLSVVVVMESGYTIALVLTLYSIVSVLVLHWFKSPLAFCLISIPVLIVLLSNLENILSYALQQVEGTMYETKVEDLILSLSDDEAVGTVAGRMERYTRSIRLFLQKPFWGQISRAGIGKHSAILDRFAQYGIVFGSLTVVYLTKAQRKIYKLHIDDGMAISVLVVSIAFFLLNNIAAAQGVGLFVFYIAAIKKLEAMMVDTTGSVAVSDR